jgi:hypothetical protein
MREHHTGGSERAGDDPLFDDSVATALAAWSPPPPTTGVPAASPVSTATRALIFP